MCKIDFMDKKGVQALILFFLIKVTLALELVTERLMHCSIPQRRRNKDSFPESHSYATPANHFLSLLSFTYRVKKQGWGGGSQKKVVFQTGKSEIPVFSSSGSTLTVSVAQGLANHTSKT